MAKRRNTIAADLRTPKYRVRVVRMRKRYTRKGRNLGIKSQEIVH
jgi:hypothetical protein